MTRMALLVTAAILAAASPGFGQDPPKDAKAPAELAPLPKELGPADPAPSTTDAAATQTPGDAPLPCATEAAPTGRGGYWDRAGYAAGRVARWVLFRPPGMRCCCRKGESSCVNVPLYTFFTCTCYPRQHLDTPPYLGMGMPPADHCCP